jgi:hypothetical protein
MTAAADGLRVVDGFALPDRHRALLRPAETMRGREGEMHVLPRFFFEVASWQQALATPLTPHFSLWEFMDVDLHERERLRFLFNAVSGRRLRLSGDMCTPIAVRGWSRIAFQRERDGATIVVPLDALVGMLSEWERG